MTKKYYFLAAIASILINRSPAAAARQILEKNRAIPKGSMALIITIGDNPNLKEAVIAEIQTMSQQSASSLKINPLSNNNSWAIGQIREMPISVSKNSDHLALGADFVRASVLAFAMIDRQPVHFGEQSSLLKGVLGEKAARSLKSIRMTTDQIAKALKQCDLNTLAQRLDELYQNGAQRLDKANNIIPVVGRGQATEASQLKARTFPQRIQIDFIDIGSAPPKIKNINN